MLTARSFKDEAVPSKNKNIFKGASTIPDECMEVELEMDTSSVLGNESLENRSGRLSNKIEDMVSTNSDIGIIRVGRSFRHGMKKVEWSLLMKMINQSLFQDVIWVL